MLPSATLWKRAMMAAYTSYNIEPSQKLDRATDRRASRQKTTAGFCCRLFVGALPHPLKKFDRTEWCRFALRSQSLNPVNRRLSSPTLQAQTWTAPRACEQGFDEIFCADTSSCPLLSHKGLSCGDATRLGAKKLLRTDKNADSVFCCRHFFLCDTHLLIKNLTAQNGADSPRSGCEAATQCT